LQELSARQGAVRGTAGRFFEIDLQLLSTAVAAQFDEGFSASAKALSVPGRPLTGTKQRARAAALAARSPLL
jgi:hypothetical protein